VFHQQVLITGGKVVASFASNCTFYQNLTHGPAKLGNQGLKGNGTLMVELGFSKS
jgi:hypothetical protein